MKTAVFSLLIAIAVAVLSLFQFERYQQLTLDTQQSINHLKAELTANKNEIEENLQKTNQKIEIERSKAQSTDKDWMLAKVDYLIKLAALKLQLTRDVNTAKALLTSANDILQNLNDENLQPLREALTHDLQALNTVQLPNLEEIWTKVTNLILEAQTLNLNITPFLSNKTPEANYEQETQVPPEQTTTWKESLKKSLSDIKDLVKIRKREAPIEPLLSEREIFFEKQRLILMLEEIRLAIVAAKQTVYENMIKETESFLKKFEESDAKIKPMLQTLSELKTVVLQPELPTLLQSLEKLRALRG